MSLDARPIVAVAGATGFVGAALAPRLAPDWHRRGLSRGGGAPGSGGYDSWERCDLFSLRDAEEALRGARRAVYLVHSMQPSARLTQGRFEDMDLVCADNFARAAKAAGVERIVYLGGLLPPSGEVRLSRHLESRREVEDALGAHGVPVVGLRAGLVIGAGGSSWRILERLVRRLPVMACPRWTRTLTQPIALADAVALVAAAVLRDDIAPGDYDIGGPDVVSYQEMMRRTASALGLRRPMLPVPLLTTGLSRLWVSAITGASRALTTPLVESLVHPMVARDRRLQERLGIPGQTLDEALALALRGDAEAAEAALRAAPPQAPRTLSPPGPRTVRRRRPRAPRVRSVQRLPLPPGRDAAWVADEYLRWLARWPVAGVLRVSVDEQRARLSLPLDPKPLLELTLAPERSSPDRVLFYVTGGRLARVGSSRGRLEFRVALGGRAVLAAIHDFEPSLPWPVYASTQALAHLLVMHAFGRHLRRLGRRDSVKLRR